uniref:Peptidase A1 domain-containing protein n=1 Tax=Ananas comosus var. bracteatus TaxID=296719 RepID=A0A6V7Q9B6_ANACO|nr:unnamed protein product [Ananas comosus var. bracteatus]
MVFVTIGTGNGTIGYHLDLDTGSHLSWTNASHASISTCKIDPYFDLSPIPSFIDISCSDQTLPAKLLSLHSTAIATTIINYIDGFHTSGTLSKDTLASIQAMVTIEFIEGLVFGCSHDTHLNWRQPWFSIRINGIGLSENHLQGNLSIMAASAFQLSFPIWFKQYKLFLRFRKQHYAKRGSVQTTPISTHTRNVRTKANGQRVLSGLWHIHHFT